MKKKFNNKGFTLVELIVVIAVLAVITIVAAPNLLEYVEKSRKGTDENALGEVVHATEVAYAAYGKERNENEVEVYIDNRGVATYGSMDSKLVQAVAETLAGDAYIYKSKEYRNSTHLITVTEDGIASSEEKRHIDVAGALANESLGWGGQLAAGLIGSDAENYKELIEDLVYRATAENTGSWFRPNYVNGYEMTVDDWDNISKQVFESGEDLEYLQDRIDNRDVGYFLDLLGITG